MVLYRKLLLLIFNVGLQKKFFGEIFQQYKKFYLKVIFTRNFIIVKYLLIIEEIFAGVSVYRYVTTEVKDGIVCIKILIPLFCVWCADAFDIFSPVKKVTEPHQLPFARNNKISPRTITIGIRKQF